MGIFEYFKARDEERLAALKGPQEGCERWLVAGLGNPGKAYEQTWHNLGFLVLDALEQAFDFRCRSLRFKSLNSLERIGGKQVLFMRPQSFMNRSGESIREAAQFYRIPPEQQLIIVDDIDLPLGQLRLRKKGSAGSHNGLKSVIYQTGTEDFMRLRCGFGPKPQHPPLVDYVLSQIPPEQSAQVTAQCLRAAQVIACLLEEGVEAAMALAHRKAED